MAKYRIDSIAALARQMTFTPHETRTAQVSSAERLLHDIDPARAYPLEFVIFRITGYRRKSAVESDLLTGMALQHDLGLLIEQISDTLDVQTQSLSEPVLAIEHVTEKFNVTSKTIQRWRRKGLPARRFVFPDGKRRIGFLLSSVERFVSRHGEQVGRAANFSQVDGIEREEILRRARRLAVHCECCINEISRRIGRKLNRSPLTILHTIRKFDQEHPAQAIFPKAGKPIDEETRSRIVKAYRRGVGIRELARRSCRPRVAIYRMIVEERIRRINKRKTRFIDDPLYHQSDAADAINEIVRQQDLGEPRRPEDSRVPRDLPPYLQDLYRTPLLSAARERALFLKLNFHRYQFVQARRRLDPQYARSRDLNVLEGHLRAASETKNNIVSANLRLVVSVARKHMRPGLNLMELISDGNLTLMRAVDSFDIHKGNRFSTYATLALMKGFARSVPQMVHARKAAGIGGGDELALHNFADARIPAEAEHRMQRDQLQHLFSRLDEREQRVLSAHYGIAPSTSPATLEQVGHMLGLSKQRVRQIEQSALAKLRTAAGASPSLS